MTWPETCAVTAADFRAALALGPDEDEPLCRACDDSYDMAYGAVPTALCNSCAHEAVDLLATEVDRIKALVGEAAVLLEDHGCVDGAQMLRGRIES